MEHRLPRTGAVVDFCCRSRKRAEMSAAWGGALAAAATTGAAPATGLAATPGALGPGAGGAGVLGPWSMAVLAIKQNSSKERLPSWLVSRLWGNTSTRTVT